MMTQDTDALLAERETTHGRYEDHAGVTQALKRVMKNSPNWEGLPDIIKETLEMTMHKVGRVLTGNAFVVDHFADIQGYTQLVEQRIDDKVGLKPEVAEVAERYAQTSGEVLRNVRAALRDATEKVVGHPDSVVWRRVQVVPPEEQVARFKQMQAAEKHRDEVEAGLAKRKCANVEHKQRVLVARAGYKAGRREGTLIQHVARGCKIKWGEAAAVCRDLGFVKAKR